MIPRGPFQPQPFGEQETGGPVELLAACDRLWVGDAGGCAIAGALHICIHQHLRLLPVPRQEISPNSNGAVEQESPREKESDPQGEKPTLRWVVACMQDAAKGSWRHLCRFSAAV